jgi:hypothetical protein
MGERADPALERGEIDARATGPDTLLQRNQSGSKGGEIHAIMEPPKGISILIPGSAACLRSSFAKSDRRIAKSFSCSALSG